MPDVSVSKPLNRALLLLGSNIEPERNIPAALLELSRYGKIRAVSSVWESPPYGFAEQDNFLNAAVCLETPLSIIELKTDAIAACENLLNRVRSSNRNAPRTIDIDIAFFNSEIFEGYGVRVPDPEAALRPFAAIPLAEIAPDFINPETGESLLETASRFTPSEAGMHRRTDLLIPLP